MRLKLALLILGLGFLTVRYPSVLYAQSALQISPTLIEFDMTPGQQTLEKIEVFNPSLSSPQEITVGVYDLTIKDDEEGTYQFEKDAHSRYSLSQWLKVSPEQFTLQPHQPQKVTLTLTVPEDAEVGGHYGLLLAMTETPTQRTEGVAIGTSGGVGMILLGTLPGDISYQGSLLEFLPVEDSLIIPFLGKVVPLKFVDLGPVPFVLRFQNEGTVHYSPYGYLEIYDWFGGKVDQVEIAPQRVFPDKVRRLKTEWTRLLLIGKYRAVATVYYGKAGQEQTATAEIYFWAFPLRLAILLALVILLLLGVRRLKKKFFVGEDSAEGGEREADETDFKTSGKAG